MRRGWLAALAIAGCAPWAPGGSELPAASPGSPTTLLVVSVAGLTPSAYRAQADVPPTMPTLVSLARSGVSAEALTAVAPASTYPAHATLASGRSPAGHGIVADRRLGERGVRETRFSHASQLRAPTLWQVATEAGRSVAALDWPTTVGAAVPMLIPDVEPASRLDALAGCAAGRGGAGVSRGGAGPGGRAAGSGRAGSRA